MKPITCLAIILFIFSTSMAIAADSDENQTLHVYLTNYTQDKLIFNRIELNRQGSEFSVSAKVIHPAETIVVTVEKYAHNDIEGRVVFLNSIGNEASLFILDQEQLHFGQPIFSVNGKQYLSKLLSKIRNPHVGPRYLTYIEARLQILDKA